MSEKDMQDRMELLERRVRVLSRRLRYVLKVLECNADNLLPAVYPDGRVIPPPEEASCE